MKNKYLENKPRSSYTKQVNDAIKIVSINDLESIPFGTFIYKGSPYPSDIDGMEVIKVCCSVDDAIKKLKVELQKVVKKAYDTPSVYVSEIKTGIDYRFKIDGIGEYKIDKLVDYDYVKARLEIINLRYNDLITIDEFDENMKIAVKDISREKWEKLYNFFRELYIIRWSAPEIIQGFKWLRGRKKITLDEALRHQSPVKIDTWQIINGKYTEVTNFFILIMSKDGKDTFINLPQNYLTDFKNNLKKEVSKYYFSVKDFKPLKMAKRLWSISRLSGDHKVTNKLTPLLRSDGALVGQVISDISLMIDMLEKISAPPLDVILPQIDNFKQRLTYDIEVPINEEYIDSLIDSVLNSFSNKQKVKYLKELKNYLQKQVNNYVISYLKKIKLFPPIKYFG